MVESTSLGLSIQWFTNVCPQPSKIKEIWFVREKHWPLNWLLNWPHQHVSISLNVLLVFIEQWTSGNCHTNRVVTNQDTKRQAEPILSLAKKFSVSNCNNNIIVTKFNYTVEVCAWQIWHFKTILTSSGFKKFRQNYICLEWELNSQITITGFEIWCPVCCLNLSLLVCVRLSHSYKVVLFWF